MVAWWRSLIKLVASVKLFMVIRQAPIVRVIQPGVVYGATESERGCTRIITTLRHSPRQLCTQFFSAPSPSYHKNLSLVSPTC
jgi:hypothetical protein